MAIQEHTVVVLGAGYVGVAMVHHLLKHTPASVVANLKVILVAPNDALFWNVASVRGVLPSSDPKAAKGSPGFADEQLFAPFTKALSKYGDRFQQVLGHAKNVDPAAQTVEVALLDSTSTTSVKYDTLIVATGSDIVGGVPFKIVSGGGVAATKAALAKYRSAIKAAKHIVVAGGGMTGVETAGELGAAYGKGPNKKDIVLIVSEAAPLGVYNIKESVQSQAASQLASLGVKVITNTRVASAVENGSKTVLTLTKNGKTEELTTDAYIPAFGAVYNTQFLPATLLDTHRRVKTRTTFQAEGFDNIFVAGDASNLQSPSLKNADDQLQVLSQQLQLHLAKQPLKEYKASQDIMIGVSIGPGGGTGQMGSMRLFSFMIAMFKAKTLMTQHLSDFAAGLRSINNAKW